MKLSQSARQQAEMLEEVIHDTLEPSRRKFLRRGALVAAAAAALPVLGGVTITGCSDDDTMTGPDGATQRDIDFMTTAFLIEKLAINTYVAAAETNLLTGAFLQVAQSFIDDHTGHAATFSNVITSELNASAPANPLATENFITGINNGSTLKIPPQFGNLTSADGIVKYALALELTAAKQYFDLATNSDATKRLTNAKAIEAVNDIGPVEAEHAAVFRAALKLLLSTDTDAGNQADISSSISPTSFISSEMPRP